MPAMPQIKTPKYGETIIRSFLWKLWSKSKMGIKLIDIQKILNS